MGSAVMNMHVCSKDKVNMTTMINCFIAFKLNQGYVQCGAEDAEFSYNILYSTTNDCAWLTVSGTHWKTSMYDAALDFWGFSKEIQMPCLRFKVNENCSALLELCDESGKSAGTYPICDAIIDEYFNPNITVNLWNSFVSSCEKFRMAIDREYYTIKDLASCLSAIIHIKEDQLMADVSSDKYNEGTNRLYFKRAAVIEKKVSIKSTFKKIYGEALDPLGFKYVKTKEPCFIRVINNELVHIIGIKDMKPNYIIPFGGVATLYRADLMLNKTYSDMANWLPMISQFWLTTHTDYDEAPDPRLYSKFRYLNKSPDSVKNTVKAALTASQRWILPLLDTVQVLFNFPTYYKTIHHGDLMGIPKLPLKQDGSGNFSEDFVICYLLNDPIKYAEQLITEAEARFQTKTLEISDVTKLQYLEKANQIWKQDIMRSVHVFADNLEERQRTLRELERRRQINIKQLKLLGAF